MIIQPVSYTHLLELAKKELEKAKKDLEKYEKPSPSSGNQANRNNPYHR